MTFATMVFEHHVFNSTHAWLFRGQCLFNRTSIRSWAFGAQRHKIQRIKGDFWSTHSCNNNSAKKKKNPQKKNKNLRSAISHHCETSSNCLGAKTDTVESNRSLTIGTAECKLGGWDLSIVPQLGLCPRQSSQQQHKFLWGKLVYGHLAASDICKVAMLHSFKETNGEGVNMRATVGPGETESQSRSSCGNVIAQSFSLCQLHHQSEGILMLHN